MASASDAATPAAPAAVSYSMDPALYIYTSLTAGSSHIVTATSRLETILRANRVPFKALDLATDDKARMLWGRRAGKDESGRVRKLPALIQEGVVLGVSLPPPPLHPSPLTTTLQQDLVEIEEWNEYGELKQHVKIYYDDFTQPSITDAPKLPPVPTRGSVVTGVAKAATTAAAHAAAPTPPPLPPTAPKAAGPVAGGATASLPIRPAAANVAEEAAKKAKEMRLQALRDKVHGKGNTGPSSTATSASDSKNAPKPEAPAAPAKKVEAESSSEEDEEEEEESSDEESSSDDEAPKNTTTTAKAPIPSGLQSPTSTGWKTAPGAAGPAGLQSPTSGTWKPTDVNPPITSFMGADVKAGTPEEIAAVEKAETILEEVEEDSDSDSEEEEEKEEEKKKEVVKEVKPKAKEVVKKKAVPAAADKKPKETATPSKKKATTTMATKKPAKEASSSSSSSKKKDEGTKKKETTTTSATKKEGESSKKAKETTATATGKKKEDTAAGKKPKDASKKPKK